MASLTYTQELENLNKIELSDFTDPQAKIIRKMFPVPIVSSLELNWDKDLSRTIQNEAFFARALMSFIIKQRERYFQTLNDREIQEKAEIIVSQYLKMKSDEKLIVEINSETLRRIVEEQYLRTIAALQANQELMNVISNALTSIENIKALDKKIQALDERIQQLDVHLHNEIESRISNHHILGQMSQPRQDQFHEMMLAGCERIDQSEFHQRPIFPTVPQQQSLPTYQSNMNEKNDFLIEAKIREIQKHGAIAFKAEMAHPTLSDFIREFVIMQHSVHLEKLNMLELKNELVEMRNQEFKILKVEIMPAIELGKHQIPFKKDEFDLFADFEAEVASVSKHGKAPLHFESNSGGALKK